MRLEYVNDPALLTRIKRSYAHVGKRMRTENVVNTRLFRFEDLDCAEIELKHKPLWNFCRKVTVIATGETFVVTQRMVFRDDSWSLWQTKGAKMMTGEMKCSVCQAESSSIIWDAGVPRCPTCYNTFKEAKGHG